MESRGSGAPAGHHQPGRPPGPTKPRLGSIGDVIGFALSFQGPRALQVAGSLDLFTKLAEQPRTAAELGRDLNMSERGTESLLTVMASLRLVDRDDAGRYVVTDTARRFLVKGSPTYLGAMMLTATNHYNFLLNLEDGVRAGKPTTQPPFLSNPQILRNFVRSSVEMGSPLARQLLDLVPFNAPRRLLDLGAGSGIYAILFCQRYPGLHATVLDWPQVIEVTREIVAEHGMKDRVDVITGDVMQADFGTDYDIVLMSSFLHGFSAEEVQGIMTKAYAALNPGGSLIVQDQILDADRSGPLEAALYGMTLLLNRDRGQPHVVDELGDWITQSGFSDVHEIPIPPSPIVSKLLTARKP